MKNKEIVIYDSYYSIEAKNDIRESLFYGYEGKYASPEDIPERLVFEEMDYQNYELWRDVKCELETLFEKNVYLLVGTCGKWYGPCKGGMFIRSVDDLMRCLEHLDDIRIYDKNGHLYIHGSHHDGNDDYELKRLTHKGYEYADRNYFACDRQLHNTIMRCNLYSALPRYAKVVYGI